VNCSADGEDDDAQFDVKVARGWLSLILKHSSFLCNISLPVKKLRRKGKLTKRSKKMKDPL